MTDKFHKTLEDITQKLAEQEGEQKTQSDQNEELRQKLEQFRERFNLQEQHYATQLQTKELEVQLMEAKCQQQENIFAQEKAKSDAYRAHIAQLTATEKELNSQLALYASKFEHFQEALSRSNDMFKQFKEKMERMAETIEALTAQNKQLRSAAQQTDITLIRTLEQKQELAKQLAQLTSTQEGLTTRCQRLQAERVQLKRELQAAEEDGRVIAERQQQARAAANAAAAAPQIASGENAAP
jgi:chromosome segregation ATPase